VSDKIKQLLSYGAMSDRYHAVFVVDGGGGKLKRRVELWGLLDGAVVGIVFDEDGRPVPAELEDDFSHYERIKDG
jgi:hypothetical protein